MKVIKKYYPEFIFIGGSIVTWAFIFAHTNVGHNRWEILQSISLVFFLNLCAFTGVHMFFQQLRHRKPATRLFFHCETRRYGSFESRVTRIERIW